MTSLYAYYTCAFRPPTFATVPRGWELVERGTAGSFPHRTDLPEGRSTHGIIVYVGRLEDPEEWDLVEVPAPESVSK